jgi:TATA-binding protein-associated factor Taf7
MMARASLPGGTSGPGGIGSTVQAPKTAPVTNQQQIILRLPDDLAVRVRKLLEEGNELMDVEPQESDRFLVKIQVRATSYFHEPPLIPYLLDLHVHVHSQGEQYPALLTNLPTNIETHKTFDNKIFLKSGE